MDRGRNREGILVHSYSEVKQIHPLSGTKGMFAFHAGFHAGHRQCAEAVQDCDWVVGMLFNNMAEGQKWMTGETILQAVPLESEDIKQLLHYSDVGLVLTGDYFPERDYWNKVLDEFSEQFPVECLVEKGILEDKADYTSLLYAVAFRVVCHEVYGIDIQRQAQCGRDRFRTVGYVDYVRDRWGCSIDLLDAVLDAQGNSVSKTINGLPGYLKVRLNIPLLMPYAKTIDEVREHIKDIEDLKVLNFYISKEWVHATFAFDGYKPWTEGKRIWK